MAVGPAMAPVLRHAGRPRKLPDGEGVRDTMKIQGLVAWRKALQAGEITVEAGIAHAIAASERHREFGAFTQMWAEEAFAEATRLDRLAAEGKWIGPLHGVPVAVKDMIEVAGHRRTNGSRASTDGVSVEDAEAVARLKMAGAVVIGATNLHEYAYGGTSINEFTGTVRNPWNPQCIARGSSGGSAVAVALNIVPVALGTDTGGSIRGPASACGVVGLKPTFGRISRHGVTPLSWTLDHVGPLTQRVEDAFAIMALLAGEDVRDPATCGIPSVTPTVPTTIGIPVPYATDGLDALVVRVLAETTNRLQSLGYQVVEVNLPELDLALAVRDIIGTVEAFTVHFDNLRERAADYGQDVRNRLYNGQDIPAYHYVDAMRARTRLQREMAVVFQQVDILLTATQPTLPPRINWTQVAQQDERFTSNLRRFTGPFNLLGWPALSIPGGFAEGLPIGIQFVAPPFAEERLAAVAKVFEDHYPWSLAAE